MESGLLGSHSEWNFIARWRWLYTMKVITLRVNEKQQQKLALLSAKTGYTQSEILRLLIDNLDGNNFELALNGENEKKQIEEKKITELSYQNRLLANLANNVNQIAKYFNSGGSQNNSVLLEAFQTIEKQQKELRKLMNKHGNN